MSLEFNAIGTDSMIKVKSQEDKKKNYFFLYNG